MRSMTYTRLRVIQRSSRQTESIDPRLGLESKIGYDSIRIHEVGMCDPTSGGASAFPCCTAISRGLVVTSWQPPFPKIGARFRGGCLIGCVRFVRRMGNRVLAGRRFRKDRIPRYRFPDEERSQP